MTLPPFKQKKQQQLFFVLLIIFGVALFGLIMWKAGGTSNVKHPQPNIYETKITTAGQRINPQEVWVERIESESKLTQKKIDTLEKLLHASIKKVADQKQITEQKKRAQPLFLPLPAYAPQGNDALKRGVKKPVKTRLSNILPPAPGTTSKVSPGVYKTVIKLARLKGGDQNKTQKTTLNTIPAGAFAKAILMGGVDASTSVTAQNDPRPVLLRIRDHGNLPRRFKSDLKACHVLASAYGDLSSERVFMRLERLTCVERSTGEIIETEVAGYIVGEDGRAGIRGVVADRAGPLLRNSFIAGFMGGMSTFFGSAQQNIAGSFMGAGKINLIDLKQLLGDGAATGTSKALDKYAEFFIKRAEQLQPVLQVAAGRFVDIVFTKGTPFGDTSVKKQLAKIRRTARKRDLTKHPNKIFDEISHRKTHL